MYLMKFNCRLLLNKSGYSLIEMLIVISVFAVLGSIATQSLMLTLRSSRKSEAMISTQKELKYALAIIERNIYNAESILTPCDGNAYTSLSYRDEWNQNSTFSCLDDSGIGYVASGSGKLTSTVDVDITHCQFKCVAGAGNSPDMIEVQLTGVDRDTSGAEGSTANISSTLLLRNY